MKFIKLKGVAFASDNEDLEFNPVEFHVNPKSISYILPFQDKLESGKFCLVFFGSGQALQICRSSESVIKEIESLDENPQG